MNQGKIESKWQKWKTNSRTQNSHFIIVSSELFGWFLIVSYLIFLAFIFFSLHIFHSLFILLVGGCGWLKAFYNHYLVAYYYRNKQFFFSFFPLYCYVVVAALHSHPLSYGKAIIIIVTLVITLFVNIVQLPLFSFHSHFDGVWQRMKNEKKVRKYRKIFISVFVKRKFAVLYDGKCRKNSECFIEEHEWGVGSSMWSTLLYFFQIDFLFCSTCFCFLTTINVCQSNLKVSNKQPLALHKDNR